MSGYLYELPTTEPLSFSNCYGDAVGSYIAQVADTTEHRANLRTLLKETKRNSEKDYLKLVKTLDDYLPLLAGIAACRDSDELVPRSNPDFSWKPTLSSSFLHSPSKLSFAALSAEMAFSILTYGYCLSNLAHCVVISLGDYEYDRAIMGTELKAKDERLNFAVTLLCKASGIFEYVAKTVLGKWEQEKHTIKKDYTNPPELSREVTIGLSRMALGEAQALAIRKLLSKSAYDSTVTPGPPLPKSHPPSGLVAKLHLECASLFSSARSLVKTASGSKSKTNVEEAAPELKRYLADEAALHSALASKWLGVDCGESGGLDRTGQAVGYLQWAKKQLEELKDGTKSGITLPSMTNENEKKARERRKATVAKELETVTIFLKHYKNMNDTIAFKPVLSQAELQAIIPAGKMAVSARPYEPPVPAFGPGSPGYVSHQLEKLLVTEGTSTEDDDGRHSTTENSNYSGAGSYF
ncbi:hypothetical protein BDM02DRAFT_3086206 [Thelephora ganbajun]|uniref:Uncharacterized protein n=1 Tax=Thelephora ganbajun TaxID=370292 RepID=A0ACB6ZX10_THEGA|nr:hypothetical protein BDM02DRAFT_3086206 [Thelephora ganbajun]